MTVEPLRKRTMGLVELRQRVLKVLKQCRKQLRRLPHQGGLSDEEFIGEVINELETDVEQDIEMEKIIQANKGQ